MSFFAQVLNQLYDADIMSEEALLAWADEKKDADESELVYLKKASQFIEWLRTADDDEDEDDDKDEDEDD